MRVFVTGATGFAGSHLVDLLLEDGHQVWALVHDESSHQILPSHERLHLFQGNILDKESVFIALEEAKPALLFHLAGQASPGKSWQSPASTFAVNTGGTANILQGAVNIGKPRTVVVTSADIYGSINPDSLPITEKTEPKPDHPYGVSKVAAGVLTTLFNKRYGLPVVEARPFNHVGPRQARGFVVPDFASQLAAIKAHKVEPLILVGNLNVERDFTDVRDVVKAYMLLVNRGNPGEPYLICSGTAVSIRAVLDELIQLAGVKVEVIQDDSKVRRVDSPRVVGSYAKLENDTGWRPTINLRKSLADSLDDWLSFYSA